MLHQSLYLYINKDEFVLVPERKSESLFVIDRLNGKLNLYERDAYVIPRYHEILCIYGILGLIRLKHGFYVHIHTCLIIIDKYLIIITERENVGKIDENDIYRLKSARIIPLKNKYKVSIHS